MKPTGPRGIGRLLQTGAVGRLAAEAAARRELAARVRAALAAELAAHVVSAHIDPEGRLEVGMDSGAWAARMRYSAASLLELPLKVRVSMPASESATESGSGSASGSEPLGSEPLGSDPKGSDPKGSDPKGSDPELG